MSARSKVECGIRHTSVTCGSRSERSEYVSGSKWLTRERYKSHVCIGGHSVVPSLSKWTSLPDPTPNLVKHKR
jgi:hypothetical protein